MAELTGDLSIPLSWCYVALRQAERVRESYGAWRAVRAAGEESDQLDFLYWGDVHFLISATHQMSRSLHGLPGGPKLPKRLKDQIHLMRHTLEHWSGDDERMGSWKTLVLKHAPGADLFSLDELEQVLTRVRDELLEVYPAKPKLLEMYHGKPQLIEADAAGRAVAHAWQEMLELHDGRFELIDRDHQLRQAGVTMRRGDPPAHPASTQQILELRDQDLSWTDVAEQVGVTRSGAWSRYRKARPPSPHGWAVGSWYSPTP